MFPSLGVYCNTGLVSFFGVLGVMVAVPGFCLVMLLMRDLLISRDQTAGRGQDRIPISTCASRLEPDGFLFPSPLHSS